MVLQTFDRTNIQTRSSQYFAPYLGRINNASNKLVVKAKFHYASWFGAGSEPVQSWFGASSEPAIVMEFGFYWLDR